MYIKGKKAHNLVDNPIEQYKSSSAHLTANGASIGVVNENNISTPLHYAIINGDTGMAKLFLRKGAPIDAQNEYGNTPLHLATSNGRSSMWIYFLVKAPQLMLWIKRMKLRCILPHGVGKLISRNVSSTAVPNLLFVKSIHDVPCLFIDRDKAKCTFSSRVDGLWRDSETVSVVFEWRPC